MQLRHCDTQLVVLHVVGDFFYKGVCLGKNPFVGWRQVVKAHLAQVGFLYIHKHEPGSVPYFVGKVTAGDDLLLGETHIVTRCISCHESQAQRVSAVLVDNLQRIDTVAQGLAHLASLLIPHKTVDEHVVKRTFAGVLISGEYHTDNPEEDNIITGHQHVGRVEIIEILGLFRPAQSGEWPQSGAEPGIQSILVLCQMFAAAFRADIRLSS